jgi:hypothetical protein
MEVIVLRMPSSEILCRVALLRTDVSEEDITSIMRVRRFGELETTLAVNGNDDGGDTFLRNVCSYKNHTVSHPTGRNSS